MDKASRNANNTTEDADVESSVVVLSGGTSSTDPIQQARTKSVKSSLGMTPSKDNAVAGGDSHDHADREGMVHRQMGEGRRTQDEALLLPPETSSLAPA
jgi:hypothetical protein